MKLLKRINNSPLGGLWGVLSFAFAAIVAIGCANRGQGPQGGPKDETPPKVMKVTPNNGALNVNGNKIEIIFDEIVTINNAMENVIISPPQEKQPVVKAISKKVAVTFNDTLKENTTYTIDFNSAIVDYNEGNPLLSYSYSFSTGAAIDTLMIAGALIEAATLNPIANVMVGIHSDLSDSAFTTKVFDRITKTDAEGHFTVRNVKPGTYRIYALKDVGNNFRYDQPNEQIAWLDSLIVPNVETEILRDSVFRDSIIVANVNSADSTNVIAKNDTIKVLDTVKVTHKSSYFPDSLILQAFEPFNAQQYLIKAERTEPYRLTFYFNTEAKELPTLEPLNFTWTEQQYRVAPSAKLDTVDVWITDSTIYKIDTLQFAFTYLRTDTNKNLSLGTDTLFMRVKKAKQTTTAASKRNAAQQKSKQKKASTFVVKTNLSNEFDFFRPIELTFSTPTIINHEMVHLELKRDTNWIAQKFTLKATDSVGLHFGITYAFKQDQVYRLRLDTAACQELYGKISDAYKMEFKIKNDEAYAKLIFEIGNRKGNEVVQLLDKNDKVLREAKVEGDKVTIDYINPGEYYARLFVDSNNDGEWSTGDYERHTQPEAVYYYPYKLTLRAFWDLEEYWDYEEFPLLEQKPRELKKTQNEKKD